MKTEVEYLQVIIRVRLKTAIKHNLCKYDIFLVISYLTVFFDLFMISSLLIQYNLHVINIAVYGIQAYFTHSGIFLLSENRREVDPSLKHKEIKYEQVTIECKLGEGEFGVVFKGTLSGMKDQVHDITVAIKTTKGNFACRR